MAASRRADGGAGHVEVAGIVDAAAGGGDDDRAAPAGLRQRTGKQNPWCPGRESNPHATRAPEPKSGPSTNSGTWAGLAGAYGDRPPPARNVTGDSPPRSPSASRRWLPCTGADGLPLVHLSIHAIGCATLAIIKSVASRQHGSSSRLRKKSEDILERTQPSCSVAAGASLRCNRDGSRQAWRYGYLATPWEGLGRVLRLAGARQSVVSCAAAAAGTQELGLMHMLRTCVRLSATSEATR